MSLVYNIYILQFIQSLHEVYQGDYFLKLHYYINLQTPICKELYCQTEIESFANFGLMLCLLKACRADVIHAALMFTTLHRTIQNSEF